jgi:hypothetical protein
MNGLASLLPSSPTSPDQVRGPTSAGSHSNSAPLPPLDTRIARAFNGADSSEIAATLSDATAAIATAAATAEQARQRALDPLVTTSELAAARSEMADAQFMHERLTAAVSRLRQRLATVQAAEDEARRSAHYRDLEQMRDQLSDELRALYPAFALKLAALLTSIAANDRAIAHLHKPSGLPPLLSAELVARDMAGFVNNGFVTPRLLEEVRLPSFAASANDRYLWPPQR